MIHTRRELFRLLQGSWSPPAYISNTVTLSKSLPFSAAFQNVKVIQRLGENGHGCDVVKALAVAETVVALGIMQLFWHGQG